MDKIIKCYDKPGKWEVLIPFEKMGESLEWIGIVDARDPGDYELRVIADHKVERTTGKITIRAVVGKSARVRLFGKIIIGKQAQETNDYLELRALTLDKTAICVAEPELEIEANNVKASHGASVGMIDSEQVMYLKSRGLSQEEAREQIVVGWLGV